MKTRNASFLLSKSYWEFNKPLEGRLFSQDEEMGWPRL